MPAKCKIKVTDTEYQVYIFMTNVCVNYKVSRSHTVSLRKWYSRTHFKGPPY